LERETAQAQVATALTVRASAAETSQTSAGGIALAQVAIGRQSMVGIVLTVRGSAGAIAPIVLESAAGTGQILAGGIAPAQVAIVLTVLESAAGTGQILAGGIAPAQVAIAPIARELEAATVQTSAEATVPTGPIARASAGATGLTSGATAPPGLTEIVQVQAAGIGPTSAGAIARTGPDSVEGDLQS
jgi:hypothetical protein